MVGTKKRPESKGTKKITGTKAKNETGREDKGNVLRTTEGGLPGGEKKR